MSTADTKMLPGRTQKIHVDDRYFDQNQKLAIRDIYDALVELITNADDRYVLLSRNGPVNGRIEIEVERRRGAPSIVQVRDFADGMTSVVMQEKLGQMGKRVSGMERGFEVRGTNSRGAKDIAALGIVRFESIAADCCYHKCEIHPPLDFILYGPPQPVTGQIRKRLGIADGTGTVVTIEVEQHSIPQHSSLKKNLAALVPLREILSSGDRDITLKDVNAKKKDQIRGLRIDYKERLNVRFAIPSYPGAEAKLIVKRAKTRLEGHSLKFRPGGILIQSRRAVHEATYFDPLLENDPHASWFFGKLVCNYIDDLWNEYDENFANKGGFSALNPSHVVDPFRKAGLARDHPFTKALFHEALKHFRPLVEEERKRQEKERGTIESVHTRKRLNTLERAAAIFMAKHVEDKDAVREPDSRSADANLQEKGFSLNPQFTQVVIGHSCRFWLNIRQDIFPEFAAGDAASIICMTDEITCPFKVVALEPHPTQKSVLRAVWTVKGEKVCGATAIQVSIGELQPKEARIEVLESERSRYEHITELMFGKSRYSVRSEQAKNIKLFAPYPSLISDNTEVDIGLSSKAFALQGRRVLVPRPELGIAVCSLRVTAKGADRLGTISANVHGHSATAQLLSILPPGAPIKIELVSEDYGPHRSYWEASNVLKITAKHPSVRRYLGPPPEFLGQEEKHFRLLLAEIVAEAVCQRVLSRRAMEQPEEYQEADWETYFFDYSRLMTEFLPIAHETQLKEP